MGPLANGTLCVSTPKHNLVNPALKVNLMMRTSK